MKVQEALKSAIEAFELHAKQYPHMVKGYCVDALEDCKAALAEIDKCEPVGYLCESPDKIARIFVDKPLDILNHTNTPLYTSPQPCECEPVYLIVSGADEIVVTKEKYDSWTSAKRISYTSPISKEWLELTDEQLICCYHSDPIQHSRNIAYAIKQINTKG